MPHAVPRCFACRGAMVLVLAGCGGGGYLDRLPEGTVTRFSGALSALAGPVTVAPRRAEMFFSAGDPQVTSQGPFGPEILLLMDIDPGAGTITFFSDIGVEDADYEYVAAIDFDDDTQAFQTDTTVTAEVSNTVAMLIPGAASGYDYTSYGVWDSHSAGAAEASFFGQAFYFGAPTAAAAMPRTGTATYHGTMHGYYSPAVQSVVALDGDVTLTADFAHSTVAGAFHDIQTTTILGPGVADYPDIQVAAEVSGSTITGAVSGGPAGSEGTLRGDFFGPDAAEMGGVFRMTGNGDTVGAFAAKQ